MISGDDFLKGRRRWPKNLAEGSQETFTVQTLAIDATS
jgi:hypothetical protein